MTGATGNWYCGLHEHKEMGFALHALREGEEFVDIGANIGSYSVLVAGGVGANVLAVEPILKAFSTLRMNVALNNLDGRVQCINAGVGETQGELLFTAGLDTTNHVLADGELDDSSVAVPIVTLDELCGDRAPTLLKVDVEGYEHAVIAGGGRTLADSRLQAVIMETNGSGHRYGWDDEVLIARMRSFGFSTCTYNPITRQLSNSLARTDNTIFVRNPDSMQVRLKDARRFRLVNGFI